MGHQPSRILVLVAVWAGAQLPACNNKGPKTPTVSPGGAAGTAPSGSAGAAAVPAATGDEPTSAPPRVTVAGDLSAREVSEFYHHAEGSEVLPYFALRSKLLRSGGKPFWDELERFGLLADVDPSNPEGLPVGMTLDVPRDVGFLGLRMTGFNCAACHVGELEAEGKTLRILGAPSRFDIKRFYAEFGEALRHPLASLSESWQLFRESLRERGATVAVRAATPSAAAPAGGERALEMNESGRFALTSLEQFDPEQPRTPFEEELSRQLRQQFEAARGENVPAPGRPPLLDGVERLRKTRQQVLPAARSALQRPDAELPNGLRELAPAARETAVAGVISEFKAVVRLLLSRVRLASQIGNVSDAVTAGPGRVDAFVTAKDIMFGTTDAADSPVSFPHLWSIDATPWLHWDGNTNSVMERNMGQAIGLGAVFDAQNGSTLLPRNIHELERWARRLRAPQWPFALDAEEAARGEAVFRDKCASCHAAAPASDSTPLADIETDPARALNFDSTVNGQPLADALHALLLKIKKQAYADAKPPISAQQADEFEAGRLPTQWRSRRAYANRTLTGVWATAPYLHNGSVPTLAHLLELEPRPASFPLGQRGYDIELVGVATRESGTFSFDATKPGNRNGGHSGARYGSALPESDKRALLEYLKTL